MEGDPNHIGLPNRYIHLVYFLFKPEHLHHDPTEQGKRLIQDGDKEVWGKKLGPRVGWFIMVK